MSLHSSDIRVYVEWVESAVFAGDSIECIITFKNIATIPTPSEGSHYSSPFGGSVSSENPRLILSVPQKNIHTRNDRSTQPSRGHRTALSLNILNKSGPVKPANPTPQGKPSSFQKGNLHRRSVSIIPVGIAENSSEQGISYGDILERSRRALRGHGRSASLQIFSQKQATVSKRLQMHSFCLPSSSTLDMASRYQQIPFDATLPTHSLKPLPVPSETSLFPPDFQCKKGPKSPSSLSVEKESQDALSPSSHPKDSQSHNQKAIVPTKIHTSAGAVETPRASIECGSLSSNSSETLASEYQPHRQNRTTSQTAESKRLWGSRANDGVKKPPEVLMMAYAQLHGSFTLDSSLINLAPFEEVKRKGVIGSQGGGVIGLETNKRDSGLLRGFGWGNIGDSIGGFLGSGELSSIKDLRETLGSRSIPILSTPQSILFVDLRLGPGESKKFKYSFKLPRGIPPSHRGKAIKIIYKLVIGTQRPGGAKEQQVKMNEIPFRVLGSVDSNGKPIKHDLMSPYIILRDQASVKAISDTNQETLAEDKTLNLSNSSLSDFLSYVNLLLAKPHGDSGSGLLSPTEDLENQDSSCNEEPTNAREAIEMAIFKSNTITGAQQSANKFEISRSGKKVAILMLARPAYRLGESIIAAIDFTDARIPCYAIHATLESSERVDMSIALRSESSILRVTRKTHSSHSESTFFSRRTVFTSTIPITATPEFITSGVSLEWRIRIEFVTARLGYDNRSAQVQSELLEVLSKDERGIVLAPVEFMDCESFEVTIPLKVYGAPDPNEENPSLSNGLTV
ncbi:BgTH12-03546 [Blumeria graminis f. sp. triticale]|uniref:BgTH12-03546 n=1 Tax=Blumeria graminis f. sp. triticale TaxID=1689686 RepID=A0A9W4GD32_BLUGR|nr:BgTH12-03546 [Blumeria graminis f. sp. triticale]